jgi:uncharacterized protein
MRESYSMEAEGHDVIPVAQENAEERSTFIWRTYSHLLGAVFTFAILEFIFFATGVADRIGPAMLRSGNVGWLLVLGGFMVVGWLATHVAHKAVSPAAQYAALALYVVAESIIFVPILWVAANFYAMDNVIFKAAVMTLAGFVGLTLIAFITRKDFSFLRGVLMWGGLCVLALIVMGAIFGFNLGTWFTVGMIAFAGAAILYDTSNVIHHYPKDRYVGASLSLFASVALLFWYVLRLFMSRD